MKLTIFAAAALLWVPCVNAWANGDEASYKQRAANADLSVFRELDRAGHGLLARTDTAGDVRLGPRFDDIDTNRDDVITLQEMHLYIEKSYGVRPAPG